MTLDLTQLYVMDDATREQGAPFCLSDTVRIFVLPADTPAYKRKWREITKPYRNQIRMNALPDEVLERLMGEAVADGLVTGWENIVVDGAGLAYSRENARKLLTDPRFKRLTIDLFEFANNLENYRRQQLEEDSKNSRPI